MVFAEIIEGELWGEKNCRSSEERGGETYGGGIRPVMRECVLVSIELVCEAEAEADWDEQDGVIGFELGVDEVSGSLGGVTRRYGSAIERDAIALEQAEDDALEPIVPSKAPLFPASSSSGMKLICSLGPREVPPLSERRCPCNLGDAPGFGLDSFAAALLSARLGLLEPLVDLC
jgi:hypothetical protein